LDPTTILPHPTDANSSFAASLGWSSHRSVEESPHAFSLRQLCQQLIANQLSSTSKIAVMFRGSPRSGSFIGSDRDPNECPIDLYRNDSIVNYMCGVPKTQEEALLIKKSLSILRANQLKELNASKWFEFSVAELSVRPLMYKGEVCYQITFQSLNHQMIKTIRMCLLRGEQETPDQNPAKHAELMGEKDEQTLSQITQIAKNSQLIEQVICNLSKNQSRTSIFDCLSSQLNQETGSMNLSAQALLKIQMNLSTIWASAVQLSNRIKVGQTLRSMMKNQINLQYKRIGSKSTSLENHIKQFLLQFQPQIERRNIHVSVKQGNFPEHDLYTDFRVYD
jgi:hypothetical protein